MDNGHWNHSSLTEGSVSTSRSSQEGTDWSRIR